MELLTTRLKFFDSELQGFAFEGAAMGLALLDFVMPWRRNRVRLFLQGAGDVHAYMVHVGVGWLLARRPGNVKRFLAGFDPLLRWLVVDGNGFHEGFFHWRRYLEERQPAPARLTGYARRAFDQGLGRCFWFIDGGDVARIPQTISALESCRHGDLWSGVELACVYAGGASREDLARLCAAAGCFQPQLAQGAAFAAKARLRAGNATPATQRACEAVCGMGTEAAAAITDIALVNLPSDGVEPAYEIWRQRVQARFDFSK